MRAPVRILPPFTCFCLLIFLLMSNVGGCVTQVNSTQLNSYSFKELMVVDVQLGYSIIIVFVVDEDTFVFLVW